MGIFFAVLSPALFSCVNFVDKIILKKYKIHPAVITIYSGIIAFFVSLVIVIFYGLHAITFSSILILIGSGFLTSVFLLPYFKALSLEDASRVVPLFQLTPIFVITLSFFVFGERLLEKQYIGALFIISASILLSMRSINFGFLKLRKAFWYMLLASFISAVAIVLFKLGVGRVAFWDALQYEGFGLAIGSCIIFLYSSKISHIKAVKRKLPLRVLVYMSIDEGIYILSRYSAYFALSLLSASIVSILAGLQPFFLLLIGIFLSTFYPNIIKEVVNAKTVLLKVMASVFIFFGLYLLFT